MNFIFVSHYFYPIQRGDDIIEGGLHDVGVDLGCFDTCVAEKFLHITNIGA